MVRMDLLMETILLCRVDLLMETIPLLIVQPTVAPRN